MCDTHGSEEEWSHRYDSLARALGSRKTLLFPQEAQAILADEISISSQQLELHITEAYTAGQLGIKISLSQCKRTGHLLEHKYTEAGCLKEPSKRGAYKKKQWLAEKSFF